MQYGRKCLLCKNTRQRERGCRLFKFPPRGSAMWLRWLEACGLQSSDIDPNSKEPPRLCQRHFQKKDFLTRQLTGTAVPSVFPLTVFTEVNVQRSVTETTAQSDHHPQVIEEIYELPSGAHTQDENWDELIEYNGSSQDGLEERLSETNRSELPLEEENIAEGSGTLEPESLEAQTTTVRSCCEEEREKLMDELRSERDKVELLSKTLAEKERIIMQQNKLFKEMGITIIRP